jgi:uncharacterized protein YfiM (DUF2279 family)
MAIQRTDVDAALAEGRASKRALLLDFNASALQATAEELRRRFPGSEWARKSSVWLPAGAPAPAPAGR